DLLVDSLASVDTSRVYYTKNIELNIKNYEIATPDSLYRVKLEDLNFSTRKNVLLIKKLKLVPRLNKVDHYKKVGFAKDRYDLDFNEIEIKNMDFELFLNQQKLFAQSLNINKAKVDVYNNTAYEKIKKDK